MKALLIVVAVLTTTAAGAKPEPGAQFLHSDAGIVGRADPKSIASIARLLRDTPPVQFAQATSRIVAGHDLFTTKGFLAAGFDPNRPVWIEVGTVDGAKADKVYRRLGTARDWTPGLLRKTGKIFWQHRIILGVKQAKTARGTMDRILTNVTKMIEVRKERGEELAMLLGARPKHGASIVAALRRERVDRIGFLAAIDAYVVVRSHRQTMIVDIVGTFAGVPIVWIRDRRKLFAALTKANRKRVTPGIGPGVGLWISHARMRRSLRALQQTEDLRKIAATLPQTPNQRRAFSKLEARYCKEFDALAREGAISSVGFNIALQGQHFKVNGNIEGRASKQRWGNVTTRRVQVHRTDTSAAAVTIHTYLAGLDALFKAEKDTTISNVRRFRHQLRRCPATSGVTWLFVWPEYVSQLMDELRAIDKRIEPLLRDIGAATVAIGKMTPSKFSILAAGELYVGRHRVEIERLSAKIFGYPKRTGQTTSWGRGPLAAFTRGEGGKGRAGIAAGTRSTRWFTGLPTLAATNGTATPVADLSADLGKAISPLLPGTTSRALRDLASRRLGRGTATLRTDTDKITIEASIEVLQP